MQSPSVDIVGVLPCPAAKSNQGAADLLETQLLAYGVGSSIAIVEVHELQLACLLQGGHRNHSVTSVKWCPDCHSRDLKCHGSHLRLASGDAAGGVVVWSLLSGCVLSRLEDHFAVRDHVRAVSRGRDVNVISSSASVGGGGGGGGVPGGSTSGTAAAVVEGSVTGLAWVMSSSAVLAVLLTPGLLLLWDTKGGAVLWKRALPAPDVWHGLQVDPLNCCSLAVSSSQGGLALVTSHDPAAERVDIKTQRVGGGVGVASGVASAAFVPHFCATRGLMYLVLAREIIAYDTELGTPLATRSLPPGAAPFSALLGVYGSGVSVGTGDEGGCDYLYVGHVDGGLSVFVRTPGELRYQVALSGRLTPPALRGSRHPPALLALCGGMWRCGGGGGGTMYGNCAAVHGGGAQPPLLQAATERLRAVFLPPGQDPLSHAHAHHHHHHHHYHYQQHNHPHQQQQQQSPQPLGTTSSREGQRMLSSGPHGHAVPHAGGHMHHPPQRQQQQQARGVSGTGVVSSDGGDGGGGGGGGGGGRGGEAASSGAGTGAAAGGGGGGHGGTGLGSGSAQLLVLVALTTDGRVWRWDAPLPTLHARMAATAGEADLTSTLLPASSGISGQPQTAPPPLDAFASGLPEPRVDRTRAPSSGTPARPSLPRPIVAPPQLSGLLHTLPSAVSTFAVYARPVAASPLRVAAAGLPAGAGAVLLGAAGTVGGSLELFTVQRGLISPISLHVTSSLQAHKESPVRGVRWLGVSPRLVSFSSDKGPQDKTVLWSNHIVLTDVRSGRSVPLPRWEYGSIAVSSGSGSSAGGGGGGGGEPSPILGVRASPCGSYLLLLLKGASAELWGVWPGTVPTRLRLLDLPFSCVEWVQPPLPYSGQPVQPDEVTTWNLVSEPPAERPLQLQSMASPMLNPGGYDGSSGSNAWGLQPRSASGLGEPVQDTAMTSGSGTTSAVGDTTSAGPPEVVPLPKSQSQLQTRSSPALTGPPGGVEEAQLVFTLADGRAGVLSVRGRRVADTRVKRPMAGLLAPLEMSATAMAAVGRLVVMGDAEGRLAVWEWSTGRTTVQATGLGLVRKIVIGPAVAGTGGTGGAVTRPSPGSSSPASTAAAAAAFASLHSDSAFLAPILPPPAQASPIPDQTPPPPQPSSSSSHIGTYAGNSSVGGMKARVAVLFGSGNCCVFDLDATNKLRPVVSTAAAGLRPVLDLALLPLWWLSNTAAAAAAGSSRHVSLMAIVTDEGSVSVLDLSPLTGPPSTLQHSSAQPSAPSPARQQPPLGAISLGNNNNNNNNMLPEKTSAGAAGGDRNIRGSIPDTLASEVRASLQDGRRLQLAMGASGRGWLLKGALQPSAAAVAPTEHNTAVAAAAGATPPGASQRGLSLHLSQARGLASCLLLPRPWAMLLRLLLQLGVSEELLRYLCGTYSPGEAEEEDVRHELLAIFPRAARGPLLELLTDRTPLSGQASEKTPATAPDTGAMPLPLQTTEINPGAGSKPAPDNLSSSVPHFGDPQVPAPVRGTGEGERAERPSDTRSTAAGGSGDGSGGVGTTSSTILALSNTLSSTALSFSNNLLRAVSNSLGSTITAGTASGARPYGVPTTLASLPVLGDNRHTASSGVDVHHGSSSVSASVVGVGRDGIAVGGGDGGGGSSYSSACGLLPAEGNLLHRLRMLASMRAQGRLLHPDEWISYSRALAPNSSPAERMAVAAQVAGDGDEARFWSHLPCTLVAVREREAQDKRRKSQSATSGSESPAAVTRYTAASTAAASAGLSPHSSSQRPASSIATNPAHHSPAQRMATTVSGPVSGRVGGEAPNSALGPASTSTCATSGNTAEGGTVSLSGEGYTHAVLLWDERLVLSEAQERIKWHEAHSGAVLDMGHEHQECRLLEYMAIGDLQTAVAFLLASSPENSARYYRDALCTLALAAAATAAAASGAGASALAPTAGGAIAAGAVVGGGGASTSRGTLGGGNVCMLLSQSAKVISAHAASIGDMLLGVPLHLAAGLHAEAASVLQESGLWRLAAVMTAHLLSGTERAHTLQRWALHVWRQEGSVWRAAGLLVAAGCLLEALRLLLDAGLPDCAAAFVAACKHAGLETALAPPAPPHGASEHSAASANEEWVMPSRAPGPSAFVNSAAAVAAHGGGTFDGGSFSDGGLTPFESSGSGLGLGLGVELIRPTGVAGGSVTAGGPASSSDPTTHQPASRGRRIGSVELSRTAAEFDRFVSDLLTVLL